MRRYWVKWVGLTLACSIVAYIALYALSYLVFCGIAGPWGAAMDGAEEEDLPRYAVLAARSFNVVLAVGALVIGWGRASRWLGRNEV